MMAFSYLWVFVLAPLPWLLRMLLPAKHTELAAVRVPFGPRIRQAMSKTSSLSVAAKEPLGWLLPVLVWLLLLTALARPQWIEQPIEKNLPTRDLLLLVDISASMEKEDFVNAEGQKVDRLTAVKEVLGEFLIRREGDRIGLVVFGDSPFLQAPFSTDIELSRRLLQETEIGMAGPKTSLGDAIGLGIHLFDESDAPEKTMIALTDGNDTKSQVPPEDAARVARQRDIKIYTVAIGDPETVGEEKLDEVALREVAETTGGKYFYAADRAELAGIYDELDRIETREVNVVSHRPRRDLFFWPLLAALIFSCTDKLRRMIRKKKSSIQSQISGSVRVNPLTGVLEVRNV